MNIGIIGYGSMGKMLLEKFIDAKPLYGKIYLANRTPEKINHLDKAANICTSNRELAQHSQIIIICVRPADIKAVLEEIKPEVRDDSIIISLNGSVSFESLGKTINHKMAKVIPSVTAEINRSQTLVCFNEQITPADKKVISTLFECMGTVIELPENELGMGSELVSCMPGFIASIFDVLCASAKKHTAISEKQIVHMVLNTLCATGELMLDKDMSFHDVVNRVATKGGITEEGTKVVYESFPEIADELFNKTLDKRKQTAKKAEEMFG